jgi:TRAP-type uncharacterized transport system fused permease subunit
MMLTWKYSLPAFVVPFAFTLDPRGLGLLLQTNWLDAVVSSVTAAVGVAGLAMGVGGWLMRAVPLWVRVMAGMGGLVLFYPSPAADLAGAMAIALALGWTRFRG